MLKKELLNKLFTKSETGQEYIVFHHSDKTWIMPVENLEPALEMYQPSTVRGKVLKSCIKLFHVSERMLNKAGCQKRNLCFNQEILLYLQELVHEKNICIAAYMGDTTTRQNNKITLQIYNDHKILCYAKLSEEAEVLDNFFREITSLKYLETKGITNIPKVLGEREIHGLRIFVQSTNKPLKQQVRLSFGRKQVEFIDNIVKKTKKDMTYETSQFYEDVHYLKSVAAQLGDKEQSVIKTAIGQVEAYVAEKGLEFAFSHGDYTPWNVYYAGQELYAFDFEYCYQSMPCYMDVFHYLTQLSVMGLHYDVGKIIGFYEENKKLLEEYIPNPDIIYTCYLLHIIAFYHKRTNGKKELIQEQLETWRGMLYYFCKRKK